MNTPAKRNPGAPKGNKNASGHGRPPGRKQYHPVKFFGVRWEMEPGEQIKTYLEEHGLTWTELARQWVNRDILKQEAEV